MTIQCSTDKSPIVAFCKCCLITQVWTDRFFEAFLLLFIIGLPTISCLSDFALRFFLKNPMCLFWLPPSQVHPQEYQADMTAILGFVLKHDDSVNDRSDVRTAPAPGPFLLLDLSCSWTSPSLTPSPALCRWMPYLLPQGSKLNSADDVTRRLWMDEFNVPFARSPLPTEMMQSGYQKLHPQRYLE